MVEAANYWINLPVETWSDHYTEVGELWVVFTDLLHTLEKRHLNVRYDVVVSLSVLVECACCTSVILSRAGVSAWWECKCEWSFCFLSWMPACEIIPPCGCLCGSCACVSESVHVGVSVGACCFYINSIHVNTNKYLYHFIHFCIMIICLLIYSVKLWSTCESPFSHHPDHYIK